MSEESTIVAYLTDKTDESFIDQVKFISGWLCPQLSSDVSQKEFLRIIKNNRQYQRYIANAYDITEKNSTKDDSTLLTTKSLLKVLGVNGPSRDTINKYFKESPFTKNAKTTKTSKTSKTKTSIKEAISVWDSFAENHNYQKYEQAVTQLAANNPKYLAIFIERILELEQDSDEYKIFGEKLNDKLNEHLNKQL